MSQKGTMLRPQGAPKASNHNHATAITTTSATDRPSFNQIGPKLDKPSQHQPAHCDTLSAIVTLVTSRGPQNTLRVETYVKSWCKNNMVPKTTIIQYNNLRKTGSGLPSGPPSSHHHHHHIHHHQTPTMVPTPPPHPSQLQ